MRQLPILIGDILVSSEILLEYFCCDYESCRGACCIEGEGGAPLIRKECSLLKRNYPHYKEFMSRDGIAEVESNGFFRIGADGDFETPLLGHGEECAYTLFEGENCLCAIERANSLGKCPFVKPISCRLYPIRATRLSNGLTALNLHRWDICNCAFEKGRREGIRVYQFLRQPLTDAYGKEFYEQLSAAAEMMAK